LALPNRRGEAEANLVGGLTKRIAIEMAYPAIVAACEWPKLPDDWRAEPAACTVARLAKIVQTDLLKAGSL
jgi:hypothetical protein